MPDRFKVTKTEEVTEECYEPDDTVTGKLLNNVEGV